MRRPAVLVVDDDPGAARYLALVVEQMGASVRVAGGGVEAMLCMETELPDVVVSDLRMPDMDGLELLRRIKERWRDVPVILTTVDQDVATVVDAVQRGAVNYLVKPVAPLVVQAAVTKALSHTASTRRTANESDAFEIVGISGAAAKLRHHVSLAARSDVNVMIVGETGAGKELVARAIHRLAAEAAGPFIAHNCALIADELFDSEFFGHKRGAFTGADRDRTGLLREAHRGVLFLDELECLSLTNQAKLLRVLDDGEVRPVGSEQARQITVRFVAATNQSPEAMLRAKQLREDLYYRLRGLEICLPPLRDRREDLGVLSEHFLSRRGISLTPGALVALQGCSWPGNIRQLRNVLHAAGSIAERGVVDVSDLDLTVAGLASDPRLVADRRESAALKAPAQHRLEDAERQAILLALALHSGNLSRAAEALGIHRSTLRRKLRALGIERATKE